MLPYSSFLKPLSRRLRKEMTTAERILWNRLRSRQVNGIPFYRQKPLGPYIVDFFSPLVKLVIEVDGAQHNEPIYKEQDQARDTFLNALGLCVLRFNNLQVRFEIDAVMEAVYLAVKK